jgi:hypothetical protein
VHFRSVLLMAIGLVCAVPAFANSATYYVAKSGSNDYSCNQAQSASTPKLTIAAGLSCLSAGDTLVIKSGVYAESIGSAIPAGTSTSNRTKLMGSGGEKWTLRPASAGACTSASVIRPGVSRPNIEIRDAIIDANNVCGNGVVLEGGRSWLHHSEILNWTGYGGYNDGNGGLGSNILSHLYIHDGGTTNLDHGIYVETANNIIEYNTIHNATGHGIHQFHNDADDSSNNIIRYNYVHSNGSRGILIGSGDNNIAHHNISVGNGAAGIATGFRGPDNSQVYNNTIHDNDGSCVEVRSGSINTKVRNNLCLSNKINTVTDNGTGSELSSNRLSTDATLVMDAPNNLFSPRSGSMLIDAGEHISGFSSGKFLGLAPDEGAIEFVPSQSATIPMAPTSLKIGAIE